MTPTASHHEVASVQDAPLERRRPRAARQTSGIRTAHFDEVRERLLGWRVARLGRGDGAIITVDADSSHWIIGRHNDEFQAMRSVPGEPIREEDMMDGFTSAREVAEMIRLTDG